jgi:hypothetical protein
MPLVSLYFPEVMALGYWIHWGFIHCTSLSYLCIHFKNSLQFIYCFHVHELKRFNWGFPFRCLQKFTVLCSALLRIAAHSKLSSTLHVVYPARITMLLSTLCTCCTTEPASLYLFVIVWHRDSSDASFCIQYFRNPGTWTSAISAVTRVHRFIGLFRKALPTPAAGRQTSPIPTSPNVNWCEHTT